MHDAGIDGTHTVLGTDSHFPWCLSEGDAIAPAIASPRSCRTRLRHGDPNTDSPRIPHDKVTKVTDSCHKTLSEGHHHPPAERFKSSLGHLQMVALTSN